MNPIRSLLPAALAAFALSGVARAQAPPAPKAAAELPAFETLARAKGAGLIQVPKPTHR
jgi:hypothetical protein